MTETATNIDRPARKRTSNGSGKTPKPTLVNGTVLAEHVGCTRQNISRLVVERIIDQRGDGRFDLDACRLRYIRHLRGATRSTPRSEAQSEFQKAKTELLQMRLAERAGRLVRLDTFNTMLEQTTGTFLTALGELPAMIGGRDVPLRHKVEGAVRDLRKRLAKKFDDQADQYERAQAAAMEKAQDDVD